MRPRHGWSHGPSREEPGARGLPAKGRRGPMRARRYAVSANVLRVGENDAVSSQRERRALCTLSSPCPSVWYEIRLVTTLVSTGMGLKSPTAAIPPHRQNNRKRGSTGNTRTRLLSYHCPHLKHFTQKLTSKTIALTLEEAALRDGGSRSALDGTVINLTEGAKGHAGRTHTGGAAVPAVA